MSRVTLADLAAILRQCPHSARLEVSRGRGMASLPGAVLQQVPGLRLLLLRDCGIKEIQQETFSSLPLLETLDLSRNLLSHLSSSMFLALPRLRILDVSSNLLARVTDLLLPASVVMVDLSCNKLDNRDRNIFGTSSTFQVHLIVYIFINGLRPSNRHSTFKRLLTRSVSS